MISKDIPKIFSGASCGHVLISVPGYTLQKNIVSLKIRGLRKVYCPLHGIFFSCIGLSFNIFQKFAIKTVTAQIHWLGMISYTCKIKVLNQKA